MSINVGFSVEVNEKMNVKMSDRALSNCWLSFAVLIYLLGCIWSVSACGLFRWRAWTLASVPKLRSHVNLVALRLGPVGS